MHCRLAKALALAIAVLPAGIALAEEKKGSFQVTEFISFNDFAKETTLNANAGAGFRIGHNMSPWLGLEFSYHRSANAEFEAIARPTVDMEEFQLNSVINWSRFGKRFTTRLQPYFLFGFGYADYSPAAGFQEKQAHIIAKHEGHELRYLPEVAKVDATETIISGIGTRFDFTESIGVRLDLRFVTALSADFTNFEPNLGLTYTFGGTGGKDTDGDGVVDYRDDCPDTPKGATVNAKGCPSDSDADGVFDGLDNCPDTPKGVTVDGKGCPVDSDGDGIFDGPDQCPNTPKGAKVDDKGCPLDTDGDGVFDGLDQCDATPKGAVVDEKGCPKDEDGDGVPDGIDTCPKTPKGVRVDEKGCPVDSDGDGVPDGIDECPDTPPGTKVDAKGCPVIQPLFQPEQKSLVLKGVNFDTDKATLRPESLAILDEVAASLIAYPDVRVEIQGHTDSTGSSSHNQTLSERRASAVRDYLVSKGVQSDRLVAKGYGESKPTASNDTADGRTQNRRVELLRLD